MTAPRAILVPIFLTSQALLVLWTATFERPPGKPNLARFPSQIGSWQELREDPVDPATQATLGADRLLSSTYARKPSGDTADLLVAWFQSQRGGSSQPHSPQVCLPASGWVPESSGLLDLETAAGRIIVNRYVIVKGLDKVVVLYWYQTPRHVIANEWAAKFWLLADALRDRRTDTSLVRVTSWVTANSDVAAATEAASDYAKQLYPELLKTFPGSRL